MTFLSLLRAGLRQHFRVHLAVAMGVAAATAVLTGALLVGDSVRGSLRDLALDGLGRIDYALVSPQFFRASVEQQLAPTFDAAGYELAPGILLQGNLKCRETERLATQVQVLGVTDTFLRHAWPEQARSLQPGEVIVNQPLADELAAEVGHQVILRLPQAERVPRDSPLGRKVDTLRRVELTVKAIIPATGPGRFTLFPSQQAPRNVLVNLRSLQGSNRPAAAGEINALFASRVASAATNTTALQQVLKQKFRLRLDDLGLTFEPIQYQIGDKAVTQAWQLTSKRMLLEPAVERAAMAPWHRDGAIQVLTYLANSIEANGKAIPYSTITAADSTERLGPAWFDQVGKVIGPLEPDEIVLNDWAARGLGVESTPGAEINIKYFEPETTHGEAKERTAKFRLKAIVKLTPHAEPARGEQLVRYNESPTPASDATWTPEVEGITNKDMRDWDAPFPYDQSRIRPEDDEYWNEYHTTPKAFVSLAAGQSLWGSRFGQATSVRLPYHRDLTTEGLAARVKLDPAALGMEFQPVREASLRAAGGSTQFEQLFLGFSFFIIAAAGLLIAILVRLGLEQRANEIGVLMASGWPLKRVRRLFEAEGAVVAIFGGLLGCGLGIAYCQAMLAALGSPRWWLGAIGVPFLKLHIDLISLATGAASGVLISLVVVALALRSMRKASVRGLLSGQISEADAAPRGRLTASYASAVILAAAAVGLIAAATRFSGDAQAGGFFGGGALLLAAMLCVVRGELRCNARVRVARSLSLLAWRNVARKPGRSTLTIGLVAAASFLIVALSAFRLDPREALDSKSGGTGGFNMMAESDQPIFPDLNTMEGRAELAISARLDAVLGDATILALRVQPGDDASCLNLYQSSRPLVLGAPPSLIERGGFGWAGTAAETDEERANPWLLLNQDLGYTSEGKRRIPVVIDQATALFSLHLSGVGATYMLTDGRGQHVTLEVVGLLKNCILQGALVMSEQQFVAHWPESAGYRMFLLDIPLVRAARVPVQSRPQQDVAAELEQALEDYGFDVVRTQDRLAALMSVQNTYLSTFQSLGGLGLLLGTFGLAAVQLRNILERRSELALMRAAGFRHRRLATLVMLENAFLLLGGLAAGVLSAQIVVFPQWLAGGAAPPWLGLAGTLAAVAVVGAAVSLLAVRALKNAPLLPALRGE